MALDPENPDTAVKTVRPGEKLGELSGGLYLMVARGQALEDYTMVQKDDAGEESLVTWARSSQNIYTFNPQLVSLPMKDPTADGPTRPGNREFLCFRLRRFWAARRSTAMWKA